MIMAFFRQKFGISNKKKYICKTRHPKLYFPEPSFWYLKTHDKMYIEFYKHLLNQLHLS